MRNILARLKRGAVTFPLAVVTALTLMVISESAYHASVESLDRLGQLGSARINNLVLLRQVLDAENGQRGYLITGRAEYLQPYRRAMENIGVTLKTLHDSYLQDPEQLKQFTELASLIDKKVSEMETTVKLRSEGREEAWRAVIETDIGREQMEELRRASERLLARETLQIAHGRAEVYDTLLLSRLGVSAMTALSVLAFFMYLRQTATLEKERRRQ
jgi:CHASE3 domain sensor protein